MSDKAQQEISPRSQEVRQAGEPPQTAVSSDSRGAAAVTPSASDATIDVNHAQDEVAESQGEIYFLGVFPNEVAYNIVAQLVYQHDFTQLFRLTRVSKLWQGVIQTAPIWKTLFNRISAPLRLFHEDFNLDSRLSYYDAVVAIYQNIYADLVRFDVAPNDTHYSSYRKLPIQCQKAYFNLYWCVLTGNVSALHHHIQSLPQGISYVTYIHMLHKLKWLASYYGNVDVMRILINFRREYDALESKVYVQVNNIPFYNPDDSDTFPRAWPENDATIALDRNQASYLGPSARIVIDSLEGVSVKVGTLYGCETKALKFVPPIGLAMLYGHRALTDYLLKEKGDLLAGPFAQQFLGLVFTAKRADHLDFAKSLFNRLIADNPINEGQELGLLDVVDSEQLIHWARMHPSLEYVELVLQYHKTLPGYCEDRPLKLEPFIRGFTEAQVALFLRYVNIGTDDLQSSIGVILLSELTDEHRKKLLLLSRVDCLSTLPMHDIEYIGAVFMRLSHRGAYDVISAMLSHKNVDHARLPLPKLVNHSLIHHGAPHDIKYLRCLLPYIKPEHIDAQEIFRCHTKNYNAMDSSRPLHSEVIAGIFIQPIVELLDHGVTYVRTEGDEKLYNSVMAYREHFGEFHTWMIGAGAALSADTPWDIALFVLSSVFAACSTSNTLPITELSKAKRLANQLVTCSLDNRIDVLEKMLAPPRDSQFFVQGNVEETMSHIFMRIFALFISSYKDELTRDLVNRLQKAPYQLFTDWQACIFTALRMNDMKNYDALIEPWYQSLMADNPESQATEHAQLMTLVRSYSPPDTADSHEASEATMRQCSQ